MCARLAKDIAAEGRERFARSNGQLHMHTPEAEKTSLLRVVFPTEIKELGPARIPPAVVKRHRSDSLDDADMRSLVQLEDGQYSSRA